MSKRNVEEITSIENRAGQMSGPPSKLSCNTLLLLAINEGSQGIGESVSEML